MGRGAAKEAPSLALGSPLVNGDWLAPAAAFFVALLGGPPLLLRLSRRHRLRTRIAADLAMIEKMPPSPARDRLVAQMEHDTMRLVAWEEPYTEDERDRLYSAWFLYFTGLSFLSLVPALEFLPYPRLQPLLIVLAVGTVVIFVPAGCVRMWRAITPRKLRIQRWLMLADESRASAEATPEAKPQKTPERLAAVAIIAAVAVRKAMHR